MFTKNLRVTVCFFSFPKPGLEASLFLARSEHSLSRGFPLCAAGRRHFRLALLFLEKKAYLVKRKAKMKKIENDDKRPQTPCW